VIRVDVSVEARADIIAIVGFLANFNAAGAYRFIETYEKALADLREFPDLGHELMSDSRTRVLVRGIFSSSTNDTLNRSSFSGSVTVANK